MCFFLLIDLIRLNGIEWNRIRFQGDNMLTALSVARDCDMIPDDAKIIAIEATEPNTPPTFSYAQVFNRKVREVRYDLTVSCH